MIRKIDDYFVIETKNLSYIIHVNKVGYIIHDYFGNKIEVNNTSLKSLGLKEEFAKGTTVVVDEDIDENFSSNNQLTEFSFGGKGDTKEPAAIIKNSRGYVFDFRYLDYEITNNITKIDILPIPDNLESELIIYLKDQALDIILKLHYYISEEYDVICRNTILKNNESDELHIGKLSSLQLDLINHDYELLNLNGAWISETHVTSQKICRGIYINDSKTGLSSNIHNPFFLIKENKTTFDYGEVISFNLMYSGNHQELVELNSYDHLHIQVGINPTFFDYKIKKGEIFVSPIALLTYSSEGFNLSTKRMADFINNCVVNKNFANCPRPVLINNWEATYFNFNEAKLLKIARKAKKFGIELFVLDDGWFGRRSDDTKGLGDYDVNRKKLPHGLNGLSKRINKIGLKFGLWLEPEAISKNSKIFELHPEYIIQVDGIKPSTGRHEYLMDLTRKEVQDYIIDNVCNVLNQANIEYIKWDMNRIITDFPQTGEFHHNYVLGLYKVLKTITERFPNVLFENCSSGGNRLDLGIMHYFPQTWASDCSDHYERVSIQSGLYYGYPLSTITSHVSAHVNHQALRDTEYSKKFPVCAFSCLGYELSLDELTPFEEILVKNQISFYKEHRMLLQYGDFYKIKEKEFEGDSAIWMVKSKDNKEAIIGHFNGLQNLTPKETVIKGLNLENNLNYSFEVFETKHSIKNFGSLVNMILPIHVNPDGFIVRTFSKYRGMDGEKESYVISGSILNNGLILKSEWAGNGLNDNVRVLGDFGSRLYYIKALEEGENK